MKELEQTPAWFARSLHYSRVMRDEPVGVDEASANILGYQPGVSLENRFGCVASCEHAQDMLDGQTPSSDDGLAAENIRVDRDPFQQFGFAHGEAPVRRYIGNSTLLTGTKDTEMIAELDEVILDCDLRGHKLTRGDLGTVVLVHSQGEGYEVEFMTLDGETIAVVTLDSGRVRPIGHDDIAHARGLSQRA